MTLKEWQNRKTALSCAITKARHAAERCPTLEKKLIALKKVRELQAQLYEHKLNYFSLITEK
jgi:hypothetical protein